MSDQNPEPLDPQAAAVIAKAKRLMLVTLGLTFVALAVVFIIIGYRVSGSGGSAQVATDNVLRLPVGSRVLSANVSEGRIAVTVQGPAGTEILTFDAKTLRQISRLKLSSE